MKRSLGLLLTCVIYLTYSSTIGLCFTAAANNNAQGKGLDLSQIEALVKNRTPDTAVAREIKERGVSFEPTENVLANLRVMGAGDKTLQALRLLMNRPKFSRALGVSVESEIDRWLKERGYVLYEPLGSNLPPASVFTVKGAGTALVMTPVEVSPDIATFIQSSRIPQSINLQKIDLTSTAQLPFLPEVDVAALTAQGVKWATVQLSDLRVDVISLSRLQDIVKQHPKLKEKVKSESQDLLIVFEAIKAMQIKLTLFNSSGSVLDMNNAQSLRGLLGAGFEIVANGTEVLREQVNLGIKSAGISSVSTILGGGDQELRLKEIPADALRPLFDNPEDLTRLHSGYQVFGLIVGQGNYAGTSERVGSTLPGAAASAEIVGRRLKDLQPVGHENNVQLLTSRKGLVDFDKSKPLTKVELTQAVARFVQYVQERADPTKQSLIVFYYFGHGLADEKLHTIYLVPEDFKDEPKAPPIELEDGLISVDWMRDELLKASDTVLLLIDACRKLNGPDELDRLRANWGAVTIKPAVPVNETLDVIKFMSGLYGPSPMVFGSEDGTNAPVVSTNFNNQEEEVGPVSLRLHLLFESLINRKGTLGLGEFIKSLTEPVDISLATGNKLKAYTALRKDFLDELPPTPFISTSQQQIASRTKPFVRPEAESSRTHDGKVSSSGIAVRKLNSVPLMATKDFVYLPARNTFYLLDGEDNILQWIVGDRNATMVRKDEFSLPVIGGPSAGSLYLATSDTHELFIFDKSNQPQLIKQELYVGFFGQSYESQSVLVVEEDATIGTSDSVYRLTGRSLEPLAKFDTAVAFDVVEWQRGQLYYTDPKSGTIYKWQQGESKAFKTGLEKPAMLSVTDTFLYCLSQSRKLLYRLDPKGNLYRLVLPAPEPNGNETNLNLRAFKVISPSTVLMASGLNILELDIKNAEWQLLIQN
jgi:hypothetical protein